MVGGKQKDVLRSGPGKDTLKGGPGEEEAIGHLCALVFELGLRLSPWMSDEYAYSACLPINAVAGCLQVPTNSLVARVTSLLSWNRALINPLAISTVMNWAPMPARGLFLRELFDCFKQVMGSSFKHASQSENAPINNTCTYVYYPVVLNTYTI